MNIMGKSNSAVQIYQLNYIVGFGISAILFYGSTILFPPPGIGIEEPFDESVFITEGVAASTTGSIEESKETVTVTKTEV